MGAREFTWVIEDDGKTLVPREQLIQGLEEATKLALAISCSTVSESEWVGLLDALFDFEDHSLDSGENTAKRACFEH